MFNLIYKYNFAFVLSLFFLSRAVIYLFIGSNNTPDFFHFADINLLENELLETLFYLHSQPLFLNFFIGLFLKITDGNLYYFSYIFYFLNLLFSVGIIFYSLKIFDLFKINQKIKIILGIFLIFNPNLIYYENYSNPLYTHLVCFLFFQLTFCIFKFFKDNDYKYELFIYLNLVILSQIWSAWQPYLIPFTYFCILLVKRKFNKISLIFCLFVFFLSLIPSIKNKILFNSFSNSSWGGIYLSTVFVPEPECAKHAFIKNEDIENAKKNFPPEFFKKKSLWGKQSEENNLAVIMKAKRCLAYALNRIKENPYEYLKNRSIQFIISHSKLGFENVRGAPDVGKPYWIIKILDTFDSKFEIYKQLLIFTYMIFVYTFLIYATYSNKSSNNLKSANLIFGIIYLYYLTITHFPNGGYETTRMIYSGFVMQIIFFSNLISIFFNKRKN